MLDRLRSPHAIGIALFASAVMADGQHLSAREQLRECELDAMLVFDASGSMAGTDWHGQVSRIARVRKALSRVLPDITPVRKIGLISYGPGPYNKCENIELQLKPDRYTPSQIMSRIDALVPAGRTPLTEAIQLAAEELQYTRKPAVIVLLTDGEETCGGRPCEVAQRLEATGEDVTVHVISYLSRETSTGRGLLESQCLARETGGLQVTVETEQELVRALRKTLGCPSLTRRFPSPGKAGRWAHSIGGWPQNLFRQVGRRVPARSCHVSLCRASDF
ncbi:MAG: VWA domain-containing protein [Filomicrobium sp.]|jgi:Ca-activated chloride channel family protein